VSTAKNSGNKLANAQRSGSSFFMGLPDKPVILSAEQIADLNKMLSTLRHDINGDLALIVAAAELIRLNPDITPRMLTTVLEQPPKIRDRADKFSAEFEKVLGITRP
jgi:hypothetical protein